MRRFRAARADQSGHAQHFALMQREGHILNDSGLSKALKLHYDFALRLVDGGVVIGDFPAHHGIHHLIRGNFAHLGGGDGLAVAEDGQTIADFLDFLQLVGHKQRRDALSFQVSDNFV